MLLRRPEGQVKYAGWSEDALLDSLPMPDDWLAAARAKTLRVVEEIRAGRVEVPSRRSGQVPPLRLPRCLPRPAARRGIRRSGGGRRMNAVRFTPARLAAIEIAGPRRDTCVVAGPGSGKTTVLVEHFQRLVEAGVDPLRILAITFTEKAAGNMREQTGRSLSANPPIRGALERAWVSTVHGFCARLLRENAVFGRRSTPSSPSPTSAKPWRLQQEAMAEAIDELFAARPAEVRA